MEELLAHAHLLDGTLGRALAYTAVAVMMGLRIWQQLGVTLAARKVWAGIAWGLGAIGALMVLHGILADQADPFQSPARMGNSVITWQQASDLLMHTHIGQWWMAYLLILTLACLLLYHSSGPRAFLMLLAGLVISLGATAHAAEQGLWTVLFWVDVAHLALALSWLGSLMVLAVNRLGGQAWVGLPALRAYSRFALPVFTGILFTGTLRLALQFAVDKGLAWTYLGVLLIKMLALTGVVLAAARLRGILGQLAPEYADYDHYLSHEVFCACMLLLATTMLTQLPSW
ncbi:putative copper resistance protein D [Methylovorus glucosotrophus]|uniref:hypothetical protein n=1 Tax=Methylovorus glucosotrophus TaxID=266009 RepID=UPI001331863D|nr:hypothetical protein [Methylovorus glucosotrophus]KAF0842944.1 putative copper resistance protein D [Methylovorus glucosotrophus]